MVCSLLAIRIMDIEKPETMMPHAEKVDFHQEAYGVITSSTFWSKLCRSAGSGMLERSAPS